MSKDVHVVTDLHVILRLHLVLYDRFCPLVRYLILNSTDKLLANYISVSKSIQQNVVVIELINQSYNTTLCHPIIPLYTRSWYVPVMQRGY